MKYIVNLALEVTVHGGGSQNRIRQFLVKGIGEAVNALDEFLYTQNLISMVQLKREEMIPQDPE